MERKDSPMTDELRETVLAAGSVGYYDAGEEWPSSLQRAEG